MRHITKQAMHMRAKTLPTHEAQLNIILASHSWQSTTYRSTRPFINANLYITCELSKTHLLQDSQEKKTHPTHNNPSCRLLHLKLHEISKFRIFVKILRYTLTSYG